MRHLSCPLCITRRSACCVQPPPTRPPPWRAQITEPVPYDVFAHMAARQLLYGFRSLDWEAPAFSVGLPQWAVAYTQRRHLSLASAALSDWSIGEASVTLEGVPAPVLVMPLFFNNFEVASVRYMRSAPVRALTHALVASNNVYRHRWGDAPLRLLQ
jgi:hypothetical protein